MSESEKDSYTNSGVSETDDQIKEKSESCLSRTFKLNTPKGLLLVVAFYAMLSAVIYKSVNNGIIVFYSRVKACK